MSEQPISTGILDAERIASDVKQIIAGILEVEVAELDCDAHFIDELGVDSLLALEMLSEMERHFHIEVPEEDLMDFTTVNKVIAVALDKLSPRAI